MVDPNRIAYNEKSMEFYGRTHQPFGHDTLQRIGGLVARYPEPMQEHLRHRLRNDEAGVEFEVLLHGSLGEYANLAGHLSHIVPIPEKKNAGSTPDFSVRFGEQAAYIEASTINRQRHASHLHKLEDDLNACARSKSVRGVAAEMMTDEHLGMTVPLRKVREVINLALKHKQSDCIEFPRAEIKLGEWKASFRFRRVPDNPRIPFIAMNGGGLSWGEIRPLAEQLETWIVGKVSTKCEQFKKFRDKEAGSALVVAIHITGEHGLTALLGHVEENSDLAERREGLSYHRLVNHIWRNDAHHIYLREVWLYRDLYVYATHGANIDIVRNPSADAPLVDHDALTESMRRLTTPEEQARL